MDLQRRNLLRGKQLSHGSDIRLPWLKSHSLFYDDCTKCNECLQACPEKIIKKADGGYPSVDFQVGECTFCGKCTQACPEELFNTYTNHEPWAYVAVVSQACLSFQQVSCRSCQDFCVYDAIKFKIKRGTTPHPMIDVELCTGCGACVSPCPSSAIKVV